MENREKTAKHVLIISLVSNIVLSIFKLVAGFLANSHAVIADAIHSISDVLTTIIALVGIKWSSKPADENHHYGHSRVEAVASKFVAIILLITACGLVIDSYHTFKNPILNPPGYLALIAAIVSIIVKEIMFQYVYRVGKKINSLALVSDAWHNRSDALSSVGALCGVLLAKYGGFKQADALAGMIVSLLIFKVGIDIYKNAIVQLVDTAPTKDILNVIKEICINTNGVVDLNKLKARIVGPYLHLDIEIAVNPNITVKQGHDIAELLEHNIVEKIVNAKEIMVHVNPAE
ncbi:cation transporter [Clostridium sp. 'deep sea']|uniref:cation diffusion facilitator family transporter n=1 Tax=Clostridium sp. 'deep sea' TaxID=2779445 RepID=UPI0018965642|nr:cation diffusion facilitator family transporter [Clostridium sp. 'deep sea']QOR35557.1 cation transporter [Clostridium sp. 'deep sea']